MESYKNGEIDEVNLVYTEFVSALTQEPKLIKLLPVTVDKDKEEKKSRVTVQYLPSADQYLVISYLSILQEVYVGL